MSSIPHTALIVALTVGFLVGSARAQTGSSGRSEHQSEHYKATILPDGKIQLLAESPSSELLHGLPRQPAPKSTSKQKKEIEGLLKQQELYLVKGPSGNVTSVYSMPSGHAMSSSVLSSLSPGSSIEKLSSATAAGFFALTQNQMVNIIQELMNNAKSAVCALSARPSTFGTSVDISGGIGIHGGITFTASWDTALLCKK